MADGYESFNPMSIGSDVHAAKETASDRFLRPRTEKFSARAVFSPTSAPKPADNVAAVGVGEKVTQGISTGRPAVKVFVRVKFASDEIPDNDRIPEFIDGIPVDVEQIGTVRAFKAGAQLAMPNPRTKIRPAQPGCSIGFFDPNFRMAGTFGAVVTREGKTFVLSNNHVLANENELPVGSPIAQPGPLDGGTMSDVIAKLTEFVRLDPAGPNTVDAAIAQVSSASIVSRDILFIGPPKGKKAATVDMIVHKFGRTTSYRAGRVISVNTDVKIAYEIGELLFKGQVIIQGLNGQQFSAAGDSGSLILERSSNDAVGLLFAGSSTHTIANHIEDVLTALNVSLA